MNRVVHYLSIATCSGSLALAGCGGGKSLVVGHTAENKGEPQVAYDQYCRAALDHPESFDVANSLTRVRPSASAYWESQALIQMDEGRYDDAWRMLMKALEIEPDSSATAKLIKQLETQHPTQIAEAKSEWMKRGNVALAAALRGRRSTPQLALTTGDAFQSPPAQFFPEKRESARPGAEASADHGASEDEGVSPANRTEISTEPDEIKRRPVIRPAFPRASDESAKIESSETPSESTASKQTKTGSRERPVRTSRPLPVRPPVRSTTGEFAVVESLSLKDRTLARSLTLADGVELRLKDTDADLVADFDLYIGKSRTKKVRGMKIGRSQIFAGASGGLYRLTLLGIHHPTHTVRVGIKPA